MALTAEEEKIEEKAHLLTALRMAIKQIQSDDYEVGSVVETMPIPAGPNVKGFEKYKTGIKSIEFSLTPNGQNSPDTPQGDQPPALDES